MRIFFSLLTATLLVQSVYAIDDEVAADPYLFWTTDLYRNVSGGVEQGTTLMTLLEIGVDIDLAPIFGWSGSSFHISGIATGGHDISEYSGDANMVSNIAADDSVRLYQVWLQQEFSNGLHNIKLGQLLLDEDFFINETAGLFTNSAFGILPSLSANAGIPTYPISGPGIVLNLGLAEHLYWRTGIYDGDVGTLEANENNLDYDLDSGEGVAIMTELGLNTLLYQRDTLIKLGALLHTGEFENFADGSIDDGNYSLYLIAKQTLWTAADNESKLLGYVRFGFSPDQDINTVTFHTDAGINLIGPLTARPEDILGLGIVHTHFSDSAIDNLATLGQATSDSESVIELTYYAQLTDWLSIKPNLQYIITPFSASDNALLLGIRLEIGI